MGNVLIALNIAAQLLQQLEGINALVTQAHASGVDITDDQLNQLVLQYQTAKEQLDADIAAAKSKGG